MQHDRAIFGKNVAGVEDIPEKRPVKPQNMSEEERQRRSLTLKSLWQECREKIVSLRTKCGG